MPRLARSLASIAATIAELPASSTFLSQQCLCPSTSMTVVDNPYVPSSIGHTIRHLPKRCLFALAGLLGVASYPRQVVLVRPTQPAAVTLGASDGDGSTASVTEWIERNVPSIHGVFWPSWWLPNGHMQTMFSVAGDFTAIDEVLYKRTYLRTLDGGTIGIDIAPPDQHLLQEDTPTVIVAHGLTGGSHESYVRNVLAWVIKPKSEGGLGGRGVVVNYRGCAGVPVTSPQFYSAATTIDYSLALFYLRNRYPSAPFLGIGFSLGGSVLARYLGESGTLSVLDSAVVVGCPWHIPSMSHTLETGFFVSRIYSRALGSNLMQLFKRHYEANPDMWNEKDTEIAKLIPDLERLTKRGRHTRLKEVDQFFTTKLGGPRDEGTFPFDTADDYYKWASSDQHLSAIKVPTLALNAFDDPIIDGGSLPIEGFSKASHVLAAVTGGGGHLGWFDGPLFGSAAKRKRRWVLKPVQQFFTAAVRDRPSSRGSGVDVHVTKEADGFSYVEGELGTGRGGKRVGWKVLDEGEVVQGTNGSGVLQGL